MALDANLFTLAFRRQPEDLTTLHLFPFTASDTFDGSSLYTYSRARAAHYDVQLTDSLTLIPLSTISCPTSLDKTKTIHLHNPNDSIILEKKGMTFRQEWRFRFQEDDFLIRRDGKSYEVEAVRKPDPEIIVARYTPNAKARPGFLQVLDYNIQRLEIHDKRGLEILIITLICHCLDQDYDEKHKDGGNMYFEGSLTDLYKKSTSNTDNVASGSAPQSASERNEVIIDMHTPTDILVSHAVDLLRQDTGQGLSVIIIRSLASDTAPKAVRVAADIKARWYKLPAVAKGRTLDPLPGSSSEVAEELYQYVRDPSIISGQSDPQPSPKDPLAGPRGRIKLDAPQTPSSKPSGSPKSASSSTSRLQALLHNSNSATPSFASPPQQLAIYLSKDRIDEFERMAPSRPSSSQGAQAAPLHTSSTPPNLPPKKPLGTASPTSQSKKIFSKFGLRKS